MRERFPLRPRKTLTVWILISVVSAVLATMLASDGSITPAEQIEPYRQSALFP